MSQFFRKGGIALNDTEWIQDFAVRCIPDETCGHGWNQP